MRTLLDSPLGDLVEYRCIDPALDGNERSAVSTMLTFSFSGASIAQWSRRRGGRLDPATALLHPRGRSYVTRHPWGCACHGVYLRLRDDLASRVIAEAGHAASVPDASAAGEPCVLAVSPAATLELRRLVRDLERDAVATPLAAEERLLDVARHVLQGSRHPHRNPPRSTAGTSAVHRHCADAAWSLLQERFREPLRVDDVARDVGVSPDHLLRVFRAETGLPLHRYQIRLRLAAAIDALGAGCEDLSGLAHELGFASHAHLTDSFRRELGRTPSAVRRVLAMPSAQRH